MDFSTRSTVFFVCPALVVSFWSHDFLSTIFGFLNKNWIDIQIFILRKKVLQIEKNLLKKSFRKKTFSIFFWKKIAFQKMKFQKIKNVIFSKSKIFKIKKYFSKPKFPKCFFMCSEKYFPLYRSKNFPGIQKSNLEHCVMSWKTRKHHWQNLLFCIR